MATRKNKWKYYIGVYEDDGSLHYVTELDQKNRSALWKDDTEAKEFGLTTATDICEGLNMNFIHSVVVKCPSYIELSNGSPKS